MYYCNIVVDPIIYCNPLNLLYTSRYSGNIFNYVVRFLGIHILMFEKIFKSFLKTILPTSILVTAFSFVFYMQFYTRGPVSLVHKQQNE